MQNSPSENLYALLMVSALAGLSALARMLRGGKMTLRRVIAEMLTGSLLGILIYSLLSHQFGPLPGEMVIVVGVASGTFTNELLLRARLMVDRRIDPEGNGQ